jgi:thioredoxin 1
MLITFIVLGSLGVILAFLIFRAKKQFAAIKDVKDSDKIRVLTDQNFAAKIKSGVVLVDFWAAWCMPCKLMAPVLNELAEEVAGNVTIAKLDVDANKRTAGKFGIRSIPTLILFRNGQEIHRFTGVKTKDHLRKEIDRRITLR